MGKFDGIMETDGLTDGVVLGVSLILGFIEGTAGSNVPPPHAQHSSTEKEPVFGSGHSRYPDQHALS